MKRKKLRLFPILKVFYLLAFVFLFSCGNKDNEEFPSYVTQAGKYKDTTGPITVITVVSDTLVYQSLQEFLIMPDVLGEELPATLMPQSYFGFRNFRPDEFESKEQTRAVLYIKKGAPQFVSQPGKYAKKQAYMEVYGNNIYEIKKLIKDNREEILNQAKASNFGFILSRMENEHAKDLARMGVYMKIPQEYKLVQEDENYQWYRLDKIDNVSAKIEGGQSKVGTQNLENFNIQVVRGSMDKDTLSHAQIASVIDGFALGRISGEEESHKLKIQEGLFRVSSSISTTSYTIYEVDGMWEVAEEGFGGSFVSKIIIDKKKNEMYLTVISINAPNPSTKRDNIIHALSMEQSFAILKE